MASKHLVVTGTVMSMKRILRSTEVVRLGYTCAPSRFQQDDVNRLPPAESGSFFFTEKGFSLQSTDFSAVKVTG